MDEIDQAQRHCEEFQAAALAEHLRARESDNNSSGECVDCSNEIPFERRQAKPGCLRCITCQEIFEIHRHWGAL